MLLRAPMPADETAAAATTRPPTADPQDPLPESNWKWRRIFVFLNSLAASAGIAVVLGLLFSIARETLEGRQSVQTTLATIEALYGVAWWLVILLLADRTLYLIAPSAEQATKMLATVSALKSNVSFTSASRATAPDGSTATATSAAGPAAVPPAALPEPEPVEVDAAPTSRAA